jgi:hypothetical protein
MKKVFLSSSNATRVVNGIYTFELSDELRKDYSEVAVEQFSIQQGTPNFPNFRFNYYHYYLGGFSVDGLTYSSGNKLALTQLATLSIATGGSILNTIMGPSPDAWWSYQSTAGNILTFRSIGGVFNTGGTYIEAGNYVAKRLMGNKDSRQILSGMQEIYFNPREDYQIGLHSNLLIDSDKNDGDSSGLLASALINNNNEGHRVIERNYQTLNFQKCERISNFLELYLSDLDDPSKTPRTDVPFFSVVLVFR